MRRVTTMTRDELVRAVAERYAQADRAERGRILDEFVAVTGHHRKHAMRLLRVGARQSAPATRARRRLYDGAAREALIVLWEASDRICGKRLRPLLPNLIEAMERHGHLKLAPEVRTSVQAMSAATIDRALAEMREKATGKKRRRAAPSAAVRRSVPVRTFSDWGDPAPGHFEADVEGSRPNQPTLDEFLVGLRTAWREGEVRPTAKPKPTTKRGRRRPDPLAAATAQLHEWFTAEPWRTSRELLVRLQTEIPDTYPETLLRTLQRRVKVWRAEVAHQMVFGPAIGPDAREEHEATGGTSAATDMPG